MKYRHKNLRRQNMRSGTWKLWDGGWKSIHDVVRSSSSSITKQHRLTAESKTHDCCVARQEISCFCFVYMCLWVGAKLCFLQYTVQGICVCVCVCEGLWDNVWDSVWDSVSSPWRDLPPPAESEGLTDDHQVTRLSDLWSSQETRTHFRGISCSFPLSFCFSFCSLYLFSPPPISSAPP